MYLCHMCVGVSKRPGEGLRFPGARVMGCWEARDVNAGNHTGVSEIEASTLELLSHL